MPAQSPAASREPVRPIIERKLSDLLAGLILRLVARALFRVEVAGREHVPSSGPALLVSNHVTYLDAFVIGCCLAPVVRFLVWKPYYHHWLLTWGFRLGKAIPIETRPHCVIEAIRRARGELERGGVVCIFAEGAISRTGKLLPFQRGLEAIVRGVDVPIVPVHLGGLWESVFSFRGGRFFWKRPRRLRHPVVVSFGAPLPASATAREVQQAVERLEAATTPPACPCSARPATSAAARSNRE